MINDALKYIFYKFFCIFVPICETTVLKCLIRLDIIKVKWIVNLFCSFVGNAFKFSLACTKARHRKCNFFT